MRVQRNVYFIQSGDGGPVKIGVAADVIGRVRALQTGAPYKLRVLHIEPGTTQDEKRLHRRFRDDKTYGEWFKPSELLMAYIQGRIGAAPAPLPAAVWQERQRPIKEPQQPAGYWDYGNPGWDRLVAASKALG